MIDLAFHYKMIQFYVLSILHVFSFKTVGLLEASHLKIFANIEVFFVVEYFNSNCRVHERNKII